MPIEPSTFTADCKGRSDTEKQLFPRTYQAVGCPDPYLGQRLLVTQQWTCGHFSRANVLGTTGSSSRICSRLRPPVYKYRATRQVVLSAAHASFDLNHHLVFSTYQRKGVFTAATGEALTRYWFKVAANREFAIDQISIVPDHLHLIVRIVPKMSIEEVALLLLNNGQYYISQKYPQLLIEDGMNQLWNASAYAGTCGDITTALIMKWLQSDE